MDCYDIILERYIASKMEQNDKYAEFSKIVLMILKHENDEEMQKKLVFALNLFLGQESSEISKSNKFSDLSIDEKRIVQNILEREFLK